MNYDASCCDPLQKKIPEYLLDAAAAACLKIWTEYLWIFVTSLTAVVDLTMLVILIGGECVFGDFSSENITFMYVQTCRSLLSICSDLPITVICSIFLLFVLVWWWLYHLSYQFAFACVISFPLIGKLIEDVQHSALCHTGCLSGLFQAAQIWVR